MSSRIEFVNEYLMKNNDYFIDMSTYIYSNPETKFAEHLSAEFLAKKCEEQGFLVERGVANIKTAFVATYGNRGPVIGFLGEFDALSGFSQKPNETSSISDGQNAGHGCGHNLLGTGSFAAACAAKEYLEKNNLPGIVKYFGCPGEEAGSGKVYMVREGVFDDVDIALTWHPSTINCIMSVSSLAYCQAYFTFKGIGAHAAMSPHLGRSALDAVELMNVGVNYLREHVIPEARIHYAITNTGGSSPNVVQANAEVLYLIRAPQSREVDEIYRRICKVAKGAALMTETEVTINFENACSNFIPNRALENILQQALTETKPVESNQQELEYAEKIWNTLSENEQLDYVNAIKNFGYSGNGAEFEDKVLSTEVSPYVPSTKILAASTDLADVSWVVPTAKVVISTAAKGTGLHTWQMTTQGVSSYAHKGMLRAAASLAIAAIHLIENEEDMNGIKREFEEFQSKNPYHCPIPKNVTPK